MKNSLYFAVLVVLATAVPAAHADTLQYTYTEGSTVAVFQIDQHPVPSQSGGNYFFVTATDVSGGAVPVVQFALPGQGLCGFAFPQSSFSPCDYSNDMYFTGSTSNPTLLAGTYSFTESYDGAQATVVVTDISSTPEPASVALLGTGLLGVAGVVRRRLA